MKIQTRKGFTLTELLIVMAIIVVLAAVAIPTFGKQLETSRETGDMEIIRNAYTEALSIAILDAADGKINGKLNDGTAEAADSTAGTWEYVSFKKNDGDPYYEVSLADMKAAFSQRKPTGTYTDGKEAREGLWKYVTSSFMGRTVPAVNSEKQYLTFRFKLLTEADTAATAAYKDTEKYSAGDVVLIIDGDGTEGSPFAINAWNKTEETDTDT